VIPRRRGYTFADELPPGGQYTLGAVAMANSGPDTNGSQFFIVSGNGAANLPAQYSLFGHVTEGLDVVNALGKLGNAADPNGRPTAEVKITSITIIEV